jgi:hypothetical protein
MSTDLTQTRPPVRSRVPGGLSIGLAAVAVAAAMLVLAAPAGAATYHVSGKQIAVDEDAGKYKMRGGLIGPWQITAFDEIATDPIYRAKGKERFSGCLDVARDHSCAGDPSGTLKFRFRYWAEFASDDSLIWGSCWHPVTGGSGDFADAKGVLVMVDTPTDEGVVTDYTGNLTLGGGSKARKVSAAARAHCG